MREDKAGSPEGSVCAGAACCGSCRKIQMTTLDVGRGLCPWSPGWRVPPDKPTTSEPGGSKDSLPPAWPWSKVSSYRGWAYGEPALPACTPGAGSTPSGPEMRRKNRAPAARCKGRVQGLCTPGQRSIQPGALPGSPTLASCLLSFPQDSLLPSLSALPLALLVGYECRLLPPRWRQWGGGPVSSHSCNPTPPQLPACVSLSLPLSHTHTHTYTRPHTFGCLQEELGAQGCTWGSCGQNVRKTPQMAQSCSHEAVRSWEDSFPWRPTASGCPHRPGGDPASPLTSSLIPHTRARGPTETSPTHTGRELQECPARELDPPFCCFSHALGRNSSPRLIICHLQTGPPGPITAPICSRPFSTSKHARPHGSWPGPP